jgi:hypothetical protein
MTSLGGTPGPWSIQALKVFLSKTVMMHPSFAKLRDPSVADKT